MTLLVACVNRMLLTPYFLLNSTYTSWQAPCSTSVSYL